MFHTASIAPTEQGAGTIATTSDNQLLFYSLTDGNASTMHATVEGDSEGIGHLTWASQPNHLLYSANSLYDFSIRLLDASSSRIVTNFRGHTGRVTSLIQHPKDDTFITASEDGSVRAWDPRSGTPVYSVPARGPAVAALDKTGSVVCIASGSVLSFSAAAQPSRPFAMHTASEPQVQYTTACFSPTSHDVLLNTAGGQLHSFSTLNSIKHKAMFTGHTAVSGLGRRQAPCYTPDGSSICIGYESGICFYKAEDSGKQAFRIINPMQSGVACCVWHPHRALLVTGGKQLMMWAPE